MGVVTAHAGRLHEFGDFEVDLLVSSPCDTEIISGVPVCDVRRASGRRYDVVLGTWWETARHLFRLDAGRRVLFLQSLEELYYGPDGLMDAMSAASVLAMPVEFFAVSTWIRDFVVALRPDASCPIVPNGIDKSVFSRQTRRLHGALGGHGRSGTHQPLKVLIEGRPNLPFKGIDDALRSVAAMKEPASVTVAAGSASSEEIAAVTRYPSVARVTNLLLPSQMADLYADADVLLKLSRFDGFGLPVVEAFHSGVPCIVTPYGGHTDYVIHAMNGLVTGFDDPAGTANRLDLLARDRRLLKTLGDGAAQTAAHWPDASSATQTLAVELEKLASKPAPNVAAATVAAGHTLRLYSELERLHALGVRWDLNLERKRLRALRESKGVRLAAFARNLAGRGRP